MDELLYIKSIGNFLSTYESDLYYIKKFQDFKEGNISKETYHSKEKGMFLSFISEYRVARNIAIGKREEFLEILKKFIKEETIDVDKLADKMKKAGLTHNKLCTSLCSKVLFLNNPCEIFPMDSLAKKAVKCPENVNTYTRFQELSKDYRKENLAELDEYLNELTNYTEEIEKRFEGKINDLKTIRKNRFFDSVLWTKGKSE
jgi:hypothetical protein